MGFHIYRAQVQVIMIASKKFERISYIIYSSCSSSSDIQPAQPHENQMINFQESCESIIKQLIA